MPDIQDLSQVSIQTLEQSIDSVVVIDSQNRVTLFNGAAEALWGYSREEVIGRHVGMLVPQLTRAEPDGCIDANRHGGINEIVGTSRDVLIERKDGARRWGAMSISKVEAAGQLMYTAFIKDITARHAEREHLSLLSLVVDSTENAIIITDGQWQILYVNGGFTQMFGYDPAAVVGRTPINLIAPYFELEDIATIRAQLARGETYHSQEFGYRHDGRRVWCNVSTYPVIDNLNQLTNTVSVLIDVTHTRMPEILRHKVLEAMVQEESLAGLMTLVCREVERIAPDVVASILRVDEAGTLHPLAAPSLPEHYSQALEGLPIGPQTGSCGTAAFSGVPVSVTDIAHHPFWAGFRDLVTPLGLKACWSTPIKSSAGRVLGTFAFYYRENREPSPLDHQLVNATIHLCALALEREESRAHIRQLAFYDDLTGLPNRNMLHAKATQAIADAVRNKSSLAVIFIDLDRFKQVNDSLGHSAGDEFLCMIARRLNERRRKQDIVCRLSGDEFVLVLPQCSLEQVTDLIVGLKSSLSAPCQIAGVTLKPSASIGVSMFPEDGRNMEVLLQRADIAMYQAKTSGRGRVSFFSHGQDQMAKGRLTLEAALREAIDQKQLHLVYQPQVDLNRQDLCGVEALARWRHPQFGDVLPSTFIPLAEECGLIGEFGQWSLREACRQLASWRRQHLKVPSISVNLSPTNFHNRDLPHFISRALSQNGLVAADLTLEITENVLMDSNPDTLCTIDEVHALGVRLAMDDFGTGYSSLSYLRRLPIKELKLDRSFVHDLETDDTSQALSEAVIRIGESLDLRVVAEGVETLAQQRILQAQGYEVAQGFLISKPMRGCELGSWLESFRLNA
ncbi:EAL domain-containing protein [Pseudomonas sp. FEN]|uniref:EAL domain-containing protein n=1 Tax=Pseudomonas sp. FEN TaxID=2767468 RepID=UPI00174CE95D|nr:EAL domain-containing protein [Pseudomonas sp. FEN]